MKSEVNEIISTKHQLYDDFLREQFIINLDVGDKVRIQVFNDKDEILTEKLFIAKQINCHVNCQWQDKGARKELVGI